MGDEATAKIVGGQDDFGDASGGVRGFMGLR
jgi:hypothetical protein